MKKCPFCGADIEESARFCLYCMSPLAEKEHIQLHKKKISKWLVAILTVVALAVVVLTLTLVLRDRHPAADTESSSESQYFISDSSSSNTSADTSAVEQPSATSVPQPSVGPARPTSQGTVLHTTPKDPQPTTSSITQPTTEPHIHSFSQKIIINKFLKSEATCVRPPVYYYSCLCGLKGSDTFNWGEPKGHYKAVKPGSPADCVNSGLTDGEYCIVCGEVLIGNFVQPPLGHVFDLESSNPACQNCGEASTITINHGDFPIEVGNKFRINGGTYRLQEIVPGNWKLIFTFDYTNISVNNAYLAPVVSLRGVVQASNSHGTLRPNQSGTFQAEMQIDNPNGTYNLVFE